MLPRLAAVAAVTRYAWSVLIVNVAVILLGALVRATGSGAGCGSSWPICKDTLIPPLEGATAIEFTHRAASGVALVMVGLLLLWVFRATSRGHPARTGAVLSAVAIVGEALIGALIVAAGWVAADSSIARAVSVPAHLVNTLFLLAALTLTIFWLDGGRRLRPSRGDGITGWVIGGGLALVLIAATGAVTALADTLFPKSGDVSSVEHFLTRLRVVHPLLALTAASIAWWLSARAGRTPSTAAKAMVVLIGLMLLSGAVNVALGVPVWMQLVHLGLADALWIAYVFVSARALEEAPEPRSAVVR